MNKTIEIQGRHIEVSTSKEADAVLSSRNLPLIVEMELLFDALVSKKVRFLALHKSDVDNKQDRESTVSVNSKLSTRFRPVMLDCQHGKENNHCQITDFPIVKITPYIPKWLRIDFRFGHWFGEFGY